MLFQGDECQAVQTIGDEGQTLNIPLVEGTYSMYAIGGASADDYVLPDASDAKRTCHGLVTGALFFKLKNVFSFDCSECPQLK